MNGLIVQNMMGGKYTDNTFGPDEIEEENIEYMDVVEIKAYKQNITKLKS